VKLLASTCWGTWGKLKIHMILVMFLNHFGLNVEEVIPFPAGVDVDGRIYNDKGNVVFEWVGPLKSPINEVGGKRGQQRTSVDAFILAKIDGVITQLLIEWKFTETYSDENDLNKYGGIIGNERLRRYSSVLAKLRKIKDVPFDMRDEGSFGLADLGYEPLYQLLRITLLAKMTTPKKLNSDLTIQDYRVIHLSHSRNVDLNYLTEDKLYFSPGLRHMTGKSLHECWRSLINESERNKFFYGYWDEAIKVISDSPLKKYLLERYCGPFDS